MHMMYRAGDGWSTRVLDYEASPRDFHHTERREAKKIVFDLARYCSIRRFVRGYIPFTWTLQRTK